MKYFIVWNEARTEGIIVQDHGVAYEARKSASSNCYDENGNKSDIAVAFCERYFEDNCTIQEVDLELIG